MPAGIGYPGLGSVNWENVREPFWQNMTTNWSTYSPEQQTAYQNFWLNTVGGPQAQQRWDQWYATMSMPDPTAIAPPNPATQPTPTGEPPPPPDQVPTPAAQPMVAPPAEPARASAPPPTYPGGFDYDDMIADPGYQWRRSEGEKAITRKAAAGSGVHSGATLKALSRFNQNLASEEFEAARDREIEDFNLARRGYFDERGVALEDHQLSRQAFFDEIGLEDRARGHAYTDQAYADAQQADMFERYMRLMGFGGAATSFAVQAAMNAGGMYANARQYGVEGVGASRIGAANAGIDYAFGAGDFWNEILTGLGDIFDFEDLFG